jgi:hypothetical protein
MPSQYGDIGSQGSFFPQTPASTRAPGLTPATGPISTNGPSTPELPGSSDGQPRLTPRPRSTPAVTAADPLVFRVALGRSNDGSQFGMFLQVFADGTVVDSDGVHRLGSSDIRPLYEVIQSGELARLRGHCGTPSTDYVEHVGVVVFERRLGRLQAHSFSYGGNPQGCESGIRRLHSALENIQAKLSRQPAAGASTPLPATPTGVPGMGAGRGPIPEQSTAGAPPLPDPGAGVRGNVIPLSPLTPR